MNIYLLLRSTHVFAMFLSLVLAIGTELLLLLAGRVWNIEELERRYRSAQRLLQIANYAVFAGFLAGIALVVRGGWNPLTPWLVASYFLFALMDVIGRASTRPWQQQLHQSFDVGTGGTTTADIHALLADRRAMLARWAIIALLLTIMALMRLTPSFGL